MHEIDHDSILLLEGKALASTSQVLQMAGYICRQKQVAFSASFTEEFLQVCALMGVPALMQGSGRLLCLLLKLSHFR